MPTVLLAERIGSRLSRSGRLSTTPGSRRPGRRQGIYPYTNYTPTLGYYSNTDQNILKQHIAMMQYGNIQAGIASWWGQGSQTDTKIAGLLTAAAGTNFRWALYYENESMGDPSVSQIQSDLTYIRNHYGKDPSFLRVNGKFVVFVYADAPTMAVAWPIAGSRPTPSELMLCSRYSPAMPVAPASRTAGTSIARRWRLTSRAI